MDIWTPPAIVALVGVVGLTMVGLGWAYAWYEVARRRAEDVNAARLREADLAVFGPEGLALRDLSQTMTRCNMNEQAIHEVLTLRRDLSPGHARELAAATAGIFLGSSTPQYDAAGKIVAVARALAGRGVDARQRA